MFCQHFSLQNGLLSLTAISRGLPCFLVLGYHRKQPTRLQWPIKWSVLWKVSLKIEIENSQQGSSDPSSDKCCEKCDWKLVKLPFCQCTVAKASKYLESDRYLTQVMCESENYCDGEIENLFKWVPLPVYRGNGIRYLEKWKTWCPTTLKVGHLKTTRKVGLNDKYYVSL